MSRSVFPGRPSRSRELPPVEGTIREGVLRVLVRRPRLDESVATGIVEACASSEEDACRVVLVAAERDTFWRGLPEADEGWAGPDFVSALARVTRPVVAVLRGRVEDEGLELALAADLRVASPTARFAFRAVSRGTLPRFGGTQRLPRVIGTERALRLLLLGEELNGQEAESIGLVSHCDSRPSGLAQRLAARLATRGPVALRFAKEAVRRARDLALDDGARFEHDLYSLLQTTEDRREGIRAFLEKRSPRFRGR